jgi:hypothetical protein
MLEDLFRLGRYIRGRARFLWGYCPACNCDAPEADTCDICRVGNKYRGNRRHYLLWWQAFVERDYR